METIEFVYTFKDPDGTDAKEVRTVRKNEDRLNCTDVCEMFEDFMDSCGYAEQNVLNYFQ